MAPISTFYPHLQLPSRASDPHKHLLRLWEDEGHQQDVVMKHSADVPKAPQTFPNLNSSLCHPHPAPLQGTPSQRLPCHLSTQLPLPETWAAPLSHFLMHLLILPPKSSNSPLSSQLRARHPRRLPPPLHSPHLFAPSYPFSTL